MAQLTSFKPCYRLADGANIDQWIDSLDLNVISRACDEFFDTQDAAFFKRGIFIKLRNSHLLEISPNPAHITEVGCTDYTIRDYRFPVPFDANKMGSFFELEKLIGLTRPRPFLFSHFLGCNGLRSFVTLDKIRKTYKINTAPLIRIGIDQFVGLGTFVEFTAIDSSVPYPLEAFTADVNRLIKPLPLIPFNSEFVEFALREKETELYLQGRKVISA